MAQHRPELPAFIGRFRIDARLGSGGMGDVYRGFDPGLMRSVAVKTVRPDMGSREFVERLYREAQACARLQHPNIVTIYEVGEFDAGVFIAMEFLKGQSLASAIAQGVLSLSAKLVVLSQILDALAHAHDEQVVHRDIKPGNVHLMPDGSVKLLDFGLARLESADTLTMTGAVMGTPHYASPEQLRAERVDARSDIFSTGALAYELLEGKRPFEADSISAVLIKVLTEAPAPAGGPWSRALPALHAVVERAMAKAPADRYQTAREMREALMAIAVAERDAVDAYDAAHPPAAPAPVLPDASPAEAATNVSTRAATAAGTAPAPAVRSGAAPPSKQATAAPASDSTRVVAEEATRVVPIEPTSAAAAHAERRTRVLPALAAAAVVIAGIGYALMPGAKPTAPAEPTPAPAAVASTAPAPADAAAVLAVAPAVPAPASGPARDATGARAATPPPAGPAATPPPPAPAPAPVDTRASATGQARQLFLAAPGAARNAGLKWRVIQRLETGEDVDVDPDQVFHSGDRVRLAFESNLDGFLYVAHQGSSKRWTLLFPGESINGGSNAITRGVMYQVPDNGWFRFDDTPGEEELFVVLSKERLADMPGFQGRVRRADTLPPKAVDDLRLRMASRDLVFEKDAPARPGTPRPSQASYVVNRDELGKAVSATIRLKHAR